MKKNIIVAALAVYAVIVSFGLVYYSEKSSQLKEENAWYDYQYIHAYNACESVVEYADSCADTGEMDEFVGSQAGAYFWSEWTKVNENQ